MGNCMDIYGEVERIGRYDTGSAHRTTMMTVSDS